VLELGSGTGLLAVLLSSLVKEYTASDLLENLKLVKKNLGINGISYGDLSPLDEPTKIGRGSNKEGSRRNVRGESEEGPKGKVRIEEIDWIDISNKRRRDMDKAGKPNPYASEDGGKEGYDLVLAVDCIYNEYLIRPLVDTFEEVCPRGSKGVVWVVCELRSSDVVSLFLYLLKQLYSYNIFPSVSSPLLVPCDEPTADRLGCT